MGSLSRKVLLVFLGGSVLALFLQLPLAVWMFRLGARHFESLLYAEVAVRTAEEISRRGADERAAESVLTDLQKLNPSFDIYILDLEGNVLISPSMEKTVSRLDVNTLKALGEVSPFRPPPCGSDPSGIHSCLPYSLASVRTREGDRYVYVLLSRGLTSEVDTDSGRRKLLFYLSPGILLSLGAGLSFASLLVSYLLRELRRLARIVQALAHGEDRSEYIPSENDEVARLGEAINRMANAVEQRRGERTRSTEEENHWIESILHDLLRPVSAIKLQLESWAEDRLQGKTGRRNFPEAIRASLESEALILDSHRNRLTSGSDETSASFQLNEVIRKVVPPLQDLAEQNSLSLHIDCSAELPQAFGREADVHRILLNLLDNAIRYTKPGGWVKVRTFLIEGHPAVQVEDNGIGFGDEDRKRIFHYAYRAPTARVLHPQGSGLGMMIIRKLLVSQGGSLVLESDKGSGTKATCILPTLENRIVTYSERQAPDSSDRITRVPSDGLRQRNAASRLLFSLAILFVLISALLPIRQSESSVLIFSVLALLTGVLTPEVRTHLTIGLWGFLAILEFGILVQRGFPLEIFLSALFLLSGLLIRRFSPRLRFLSLRARFGLSLRILSVLMVGAEGYLALIRLEQLISPYESRLGGVDTVKGGIERWIREFDSGILPREGLQANVAFFTSAFPAAEFLVLKYDGVPVAESINFLFFPRVWSDEVLEQLRSYFDRGLSRTEEFRFGRRKYHAHVISLGDGEAILATAWPSGPFLLLSQRIGQLYLTYGLLLISLTCAIPIFLVDYFVLKPFQRRFHHIAALAHGIELNEDRDFPSSEGRDEISILEGGVSALSKKLYQSMEALKQGAELLERFFEALLSRLSKRADRLLKLVEQAEHAATDLESDKRIRELVRANDEQSELLHDVSQHFRITRQNKPSGTAFVFETLNLAILEVAEASGFVRKGVSVKGGEEFRVRIDERLLQRIFVDVLHSLLDANQGITPEIQVQQIPEFNGLDFLVSNSQNIPVSSMPSDLGLAKAILDAYGGQILPLPNSGIRLRVLESSIVLEEENDKSGI